MILWILIAVCASGLLASCPKGIKVRKEFRDMSRKEWLDFRNALTILMTTPGKVRGTSAYDEIVKIHLDNVPVAHGTPYFFTWHRAYLNFVEERMREINPNVTIPYWDWAYDARRPLASPIFTTDYLGIRVGPRGDCRQRCAYPTPHCLTRNYDPSNFSTFYDHAALNTLINDSSLSYDEYRQWIEAAPHGRVHASIGGEGGDMTMMQSPNDSIFWLHHTMIDKLWDDFQKKGNNRNKLNIANYRFNGRFGGRSVSLSDITSPFGIRIRDMMDTKALCYEYQPFSLLSLRRMQANSADQKDPLIEHPIPFQPPDALPEHWIAMINAPIEVVRQQEQSLTEAMLKEEQEQEKEEKEEGKELPKEKDNSEASIITASEIFLLTIFLMLLIK